MGAALIGLLVGGATINATKLSPLTGLHCLWENAPVVARLHRVYPALRFIF